MAGETGEVQEISEAEAIASFNAGLELRNTEPTSQPEPTPTPEPAAPQEPALKEDAPKPFNVNEKDWTELRNKAAAIDEIRADSKRQIDTLSGHVGGLKQIVEQLRQRGATKLTPESLKRMSEQYPELTAALAEDLSEFLSAPQGKTPDSDDLDKRAKTLVEAEISKATADLNKKILRSYHRDWVDVLRSDEFKAFQLTLTPEENQKLMQSTDGEYIADRITDFKEAKARADALRKPATPAPVNKTAAARQARIESAVPAKGTGGAQVAPDAADEFNSGYALKGKG